MHVSERGRRTAAVMTWLLCPQKVRGTRRSLKQSSNPDPTETRTCTRVGHNVNNAQALKSSAVW